jgi:hypothetical protein
MKSKKMRRMKNKKSMHCLAVSSKVNKEIVDGSISCFSAKIVQATMVEITVTQLEEIISLIFANWHKSGKTPSI